MNDAGETSNNNGNLGLPEFPADGYIGICAEFAELYSRYSESPKAFYFLDSLTLLGNIFSGSVTFKQQQPRMYLLKVQESAFGRKSTSLKAAKKVIKAATTRASEMTAEKVSLDNVLATSPADRNVEERRILKVLPNAATGEAVVKEFSTCSICGSSVNANVHEDKDDKSHDFETLHHIAFTYDEFRTFEKKAGSANSTLMNVFTEAFESNELSNVSAGSPYYADNAHVVFLANTTTANFNSMKEAREMLDTGFLNRFFIIAASSDKRFRWAEQPPAADVDTLVEKFAYIIHKVQAVRERGEELEVQITDAADALWKTFYDELPRTEAYARIDTIGTRLMLLFAITRGENVDGNVVVVDVEIMQKVILLLSYQMKIRMLLRPMTGDKSSRIEQAIYRRLESGPATDAQLLAATNCERDGCTEEFDSKLLHLKANGRLRQIPLTGKQKAVRWEKNAAKFA